MRDMKLGVRRLVLLALILASLAYHGARVYLTASVARIMTEADAFAAGAKQHDDMTLIVMKVAE